MRLADVVLDVVFPSYARYSLSSGVITGRESKQPHDCFILSGLRQHARERAEVMACSYHLYLWGRLVMERHP